MATTAQCGLVSVTSLFQLRLFRVASVIVAILRAIIRLTAQIIPVFGRARSKRVLIKLTLLLLCPVAFVLVVRYTTT